MSSYLTVSCQIQHPVERLRTASLTALPVNEQSLYTWVPQATLDAIGVPREKEITLLTANNKRITRSLGFAIIQLGKHYTIDEVIFAKRGDPCWLGKRSLLGLNLEFDPVQHKLKVVAPYLATVVDKLAPLTRNRSLGLIAPPP